MTSRKAINQPLHAPAALALCCAADLRPLAWCLNTTKTATIKG
jgi:hypothetical protein